MYAHGAPGDERVVLHLTAARSTRMARQGTTSAGQWIPLSDWRADGERLVFADFRNSREFVADLGYNTLGGTWERGTTRGGWWCAHRAESVAAESRSLRPSAAEFFVPPLVPNVSASPRYPRQAIRAAKEGRAVVCFLVDSSGVVLEPEIVELSDEVFRDESIVAIYRSSYRPWRSGTTARPGCRSYIYELDAVY